MLRTPLRISLAGRAAALLPALLAAACGDPDPVPDPANPGSGSRNLILVVVDTLRADRLGCYGHDRDTSPSIDALAAESVLFENAFAPSPYTAASHASLFSSLYPNTHMVWNKAELENGARVFPALSKNAVTLAEAMRDAGVQTAAVADGGFVKAERGLHQGFEFFESENTGVADRVDRALEWLREERDPDQPFFLFLHTYEVHSPYMPELEYLDRFDPDYRGPLREAVRKAREWVAANPDANPINKPQERFFKPLFEAANFSPEDKAFVRTLYDAEIAMVDDQLARLLAYLEESGLDQDTALVLTSDHGEEFWEHDYWGHHKLWEETLRIPLIARLPGGPQGERRQDPIDLVDLMPSLLTELGAPVPEMASGRVVDLREAGPADPDHYYVAQANAPFVLASFRYADGKAIFFVSPDEGEAVFDPQQDRGERQDLSGTEAGRRILERAKADRRAFGARTEAKRKKYDLFPELRSQDRFSPEMLAELEALGYIDSDGDDEEEVVEPDEESAGAEG